MLPANKITEMKRKSRGGSKAAPSKTIVTGEFSG
jgi:hypothetical protein